MSKIVKVVVPVSDETGDRLSEHFGRAPFFAVYMVTSSKIEEKGVVPNKSDHFGGKGHPPELIIAMGAEVVISLGMGIRAIHEFQNANVAVLKSQTEKTSEALELYQEGKLEELTQGCLHGHDH